MDKNLAIRIISALVLLLGIFSLHFFFQEKGLMTFGIVVICLGLFEYKQIILNRHLKVSGLTSISFLLISGLSLILFLTLSLSPFVYLSLFLFSLVGVTQHRSTQNVENVFQEICYSFVGYIYALVLPVFILKILSIKQTGIQLFVALLVITFAGDTMAYICGRLFGKNLVMPSISPKKTMAGSVGGLIASIGAAAYLLYFQWGFTGLFVALSTGFFCGLSAQIGDFFESLLKRISGVKDSGKIMPGHGGILDRVDGLYFAAPVFYSFYYLSF